MKIDKEFFLDGSDDFSNRQKNVFAELDRMSSSQPENRYVQQEHEFRERRAVVASGRKETRPFSGQESLFKSGPEPLKRRSNSMKLDFVPDFVKHPTKWKKYHLGDDVMTDRLNKAAAMSFLKEIKERQKSDDDGPSTSSMPPPVKFNRHVKSDGSTKSADQVNPIEKPTFVDGKLTMPEYVVGAAKKKEKPPKKTGVVAAGTAVKLGHLEEEEEEE